MNLMDVLPEVVTTTGAYDCTAVYPNVVAIQEGLYVVLPKVVTNAGEYDCTTVDSNAV
jgi:hypothetical protein